jgi:hypothetical protein
MKLTTGILAAGLMTGGLWAQNPNVIQNVQSTMSAVQQQKTKDSNAALGINRGTSASQAAKPAAGAPAKTAPAATAAPKSTVTPPAAKTQAASVAKSPAAPVAKSAVSAPQVAVAAKKVAPKKAAKTVISAAPKAPADGKTAQAKPAEAKAAEPGKSADTAKAPKPEEKKWAMNGKRDPFFSPIVQAPTGSGCSTGKKCLEIGQINLHGVVKSDTGFIAVVTNNLGKAYFLRENDPVFNGYVMRITGDSVVFQETYEDKLGKPLTREVVKRIFTPAV